MRSHSKTALTAALTIACVAIGAMPAMADARTPAATAGSGPDSIAVVGPGPYQVPASSPEQADALGLALRVARENPDDFGYPWVDAGGRVTPRWVTPAGRDRLARVAGTGAPAGRQSTLSYRRLEEIKADVTTLARKGVVDADTIWRVQPDDQHARIVITVTKLSPDLLSALAARYGTEAVAVHVDPQRRLPQHNSRDNDGIPFSGGARVRNPRGGTCTLGFAWSLGFLSAGHCAPDGGDFASPTGTIIGNTRIGEDENFRLGYGTMPFVGQGQLRGDLALIRAPSSYALPQMFTGGVDSITRAPVAEMWHRPPVVGDQYCTGGARSGEICGWRVTDTRVDIMTEFPFEWTNNLTEGFRPGNLHMINGDSGGSVYTVRGDGKIAAKGITSASLNNFWPDGNFHYFTDIWEAYYGLPGYLAVEGPSPPGTGSADKPSGGSGSPPVPAPSPSGLKADLNGDRIPDLLTQLANGDVYVYPGSGSVSSTTTFWSGTRIGNWANHTNLALGDLNNDGKADLLSQVAGNGDVYVYPGSGSINTSTTFWSGTRIGNWANHTNLILGDLNHDGKADLLSQIAGQGDLYAYPGSGSINTSTTFWSGTRVGNWANHTNLALGDLNNDGLTDLLSQVAGNGDVYVYPGSGAINASTTFWSGIHIGNWANHTNLVLGDLNKDRRPDLLSQVQSTGELYVYRGSGSINSSTTFWSGAPIGNWAGHTNLTN